MNLREDFTFDNQEYTCNFAKREMENSHYIFEAIPHSYKNLKESQDLQHFLHIIRVSVLSYIGAAYALKEKDLFLEAGHTLLDYPLFKLDLIENNCDIISLEACLCILLNRYDEIKSVIDNYSPNTTDTSSMSAIQLLGLSMIYLMRHDNDNVPSLINQVNSLCDKKTYLMVPNQYFQLLANAISSYVNKNPVEFTNNMSKLDKFEFNYINEQTTRARKIAPTPFMCYDFFDIFSATLLKLAVDSKFIDMPTKPYHFFDIEWINQ